MQSGCLAAPYLAPKKAPMMTDTAEQRVCVRGWWLALPPVSLAACMCGAPSLQFIEMPAGDRPLAANGDGASSVPKDGLIPGRPKKGATTMACIRSTGQAAPRGRPPIAVYYLLVTSSSPVSRDVEISTPEGTIAACLVTSYLSPDADVLTYSHTATATSTRMRRRGIHPHT